MGAPVSIRLDDEVREELEAEAWSRGIGLATLLRDIASRAPRDARKARIREASAMIGDRVATDPDARLFYQEVGTPTTDAG